MTELAVSPTDLVSLVPVAAAAAARVEPGSVAAVLAAGSQALGGLASAEALAAVAGVWLPVLRRLEADWQAFATLAGRAADDYTAVEARVAAAVA